MNIWKILQLKGYFFEYFNYYIQHCFIYRPSDSTVSVDTGIKPRTVAALALTIKNMPRSIILCQQKLNPSRETDPRSTILYGYRYEAS
jgi:hypothetical protein